MLPFEMIELYLWSLDAKLGVRARRAWLIVLAGDRSISAMDQDSASLFTRLAPVLNVPDVAAERAFYERLGLPVIYEGDEYPDFIGFGTETVHFGIQKASAANDPPSVLTWQIGVTDIESAMERCRSAGISFELEVNNPAPGWSYRRLLIRTPGGYRLALEGPNE
jgi:catechol 2,3-dioxygenase-like lactoylglutathione lyase family enzyme